MMRTSGRNKARRTSCRAAECIRVANASPPEIPGNASSRGLRIARASDWQSCLRRSISLLLLPAILAVMMPAGGLHLTEASAQPNGPSQTTTIQRSPATEFDDAPAGQAQHSDWELQDPTNWSPLYLLALAFVAGVSFILGRISVRPSKAALRTDIDDVFEKQKDLGDAYHFLHLGPVLMEAKKAVLAALRKRDLI